MLLYTNCTFMACAGFILPFHPKIKVTLIDFFLNLDRQVAPKSETLREINFSLRHVFKYPANIVRTIFGKLPPKGGGAFGPVF